MPLKALDVIWDRTHIGRLSETGSRAMAFQYAASYLASAHARPISLSLPLQEDPFGPEQATSWFANLLPEGAVRGQVARRLGVSERNEFALLAGIGGDCAGALSLRPADDRSDDSPDDRGELIPLTWTDLEARINTTPRSSLMAMAIGEGDLRLSLAGAQDKLPVRIAAGNLYLPAGPRASTHLIKIAGAGFPGLVVNELYCLTLAQRAGLRVPPVDLAPTATPILLVERYDRRVTPEGDIVRLHQEDFCQILATPPERKYENEGGPSLATIFTALATGSTTPLPDKRDLLRWVVFNYIVGNADAHAKNVSLLHGALADRTGPRLAPFYDIVCTEVYETIARKQAQRIGGEYRPRSIARRHWERLAAEIGVKFTYLSAIAMELCDEVASLADLLTEELADRHGGADILDRIVAVVERRIGRLRVELGS